MKKIILTAIAVCAFSFANAQEGGFKAGINLGLPLGDIEDSYSFTVGLDVAYTWLVADKFHAGITTGYAHYMGKTQDVLGLQVEIDDAGFIPLAATAQYSISDNLFVGADIGYAIGVSPDGNDGGFLYQPKFGYQTEMLELYLGYKGISVTGGTFSSINLGFNYKF
ncbi:MAG TPA: outer membrane beta-barrel protein [Flavobacterium sp.]|nr:outer membrane beta-barrel protein [Flavobacterium sp.]